MSNASAYVPARRPSCWHANAYGVGMPLTVGLNGPPSWSRLSRSFLLIAEVMRRSLSRTSISASGVAVASAASVMTLNRACRPASTGDNAVPRGGLSVARP